MRVILLQDVEKTGKKGEVKEVSDGFARNFLFPRLLAKPATKPALRAVAMEKEREARERSEEYQKFKAFKDRLKTLSLHFKVKIGEKGRAFGSVSPAKIRDALKKEKIPVEKEWILLEKPLKTTGETMVKIKFPKEVIGEVKVVVESESERGSAL